MKPWDGSKGLEWTVPSPAPHHTFETPPNAEELNAAGI
jgi:cytochrome c oxidase subunit 1